MGGLIQSSGRGRKHRCGACGAVFFDMERELTVCPKCETPYEPTAHLPRGESAHDRQSWRKGARRPQPEPVPETPPVETSEDGGEGVLVLDAPDRAGEDEAEGENDDDQAEGEKHPTEDDESPVAGRDKA
jgi:hypothetical protein